MTGPSFAACLAANEVPREHWHAATAALGVFLEEHMPQFIPYLDAQTAAAEAETLRLVSGEA